MVWRQLTILPCAIQRAAQPIDVVRPVAVVLDILLATPQHPHRSRDVACDARADDDAVDLESPSKTAPDQVVVQLDLLGLEAQRCKLRDRAIRRLRAGPDLARALTPFERAVHRFEGRVREERLVI